MNKWLTNGKIFIIFGATSAAGFVYVYYFVKETKGLSEAEIKLLYGKTRSSSVKY